MTYIYIPLATQHYKINKNKFITQKNHAMLINLMDIGLSNESLKTILNKLKKDKEVVKTAVNKYGIALQYADPSLQEDKDLKALL